MFDYILNCIAGSILFSCLLYLEIDDFVMDLIPPGVMVFRHLDVAMARERFPNPALAQPLGDCFPDMAGMELKEDTVINTDTAIDSMGFTMVICRLEANFDVRIPDRQWSKLQTLGDVVDAIEKRLAKA